MAGKRQHYIPRFLQRGFLVTPLEGGERTWLHMRRTEARLVGIRDVGVSENFYSKLAVDGAPTLDDHITALEGGLDGDLIAIKCAPVGSNVDPEVAARLVTHLTLRTAHVRSIFKEGAIQILDQVAELVTDLGRLRDYMGVDETDPAGIPTKLVDEVVKALQLQLRSLPLPSPLAQRVVGFLIRERFDVFYEQYSTMISQAFDEMRKGISSTVRDSHNKALVTADQSRWEKDLATLSWQTHSVSGAVLPDCIVLVREVGGVFTPLLLSERERVDLVVLPIAHDRLLIGSAITNVDIAIASINEASASCSDSFYISHQAGDGEGLSCLIGQRCARAIGVSVDEAISALRHIKVVRTGGQPPERRIVEIEPLGLFTFSLTCLDFADVETAARLGDVLKVIVQEVGRDMPLSRMDGMTFAADYTSALDRLDRGDPALGVDRSQPRDYGRAVAKCVRVVRGGESKQHVVFDAVIAQALLGCDGDGRASAIHMIVSMLANVAHSVLYETKLEETPMASADSVLRLLHQSVSIAPGMYFAARESAFSDPKAGERYADLTRDSLASAREVIRKARLTYRLSNDLDGLLEVALPQISFVLGHVAQWLGHRDGLPSQDGFPGSSLPDDMKALNLDLWLELFGRDLRRLYDIDGQFTSANIFALGSHVERLLWTVQIYPWSMQDGTPYVSVPIGDDERFLNDRAPVDASDGFRLGRLDNSRQ
jgi:hypothetical protein